MSQPAPVAASATPKEVKDMSPTELIDRYERDIVYDCHSLRARISRSHARRFLQQAGRSVLMVIADHLVATKDRARYGGYDSNRELQTAWLVLFHDIAQDSGITHPFDGPAVPTFHELEAWARANAQ